jgi:hypothetical protein
MRAIDITAENAKALRELFRQSIETYSPFELAEINKRDITGPTHSGNSRRFAEAATASKW